MGASMGKVCLSLSASRSSIALVSAMINCLYFILLGSAPGPGVLRLEVNGCGSIFTGSAGQKVNAMQE